MLSHEKLEKKQAAMRERQAKKAHSGPVANEPSPMIDMERFRKLHAATCLIKFYGWSLPRAAARFSIDIKILTEWAAKVCPLLEIVASPRS